MSEVTDDLILKVSMRALSSYERLKGSQWDRLGGSREEALSYAMERAWLASVNHDEGEDSLTRHLVSQARYGVMDYVRELRGNEVVVEKVVKVGLDDEEVVWRQYEVSYEEAGYDPPEELAAVQQALADSRDRKRKALRAVIEGAMLALSKPQRKVVRLRHRLDDDDATSEMIFDLVARKMGMSLSRTHGLYVEALEILRGELRAEELLRSGFKLPDES